MWGDCRDGFRHGTLVIWPPDDVRAVVNALRECHDPASAAICEAVKRDSAALGRTIIDVVNPLDHATFAATDRGPAIPGSPDTIAETLWRYGEAGVTHLMLDVLPVSVASVEAMGPVF